MPDDDAPDAAEPKTRPALIDLEAVRAVSEAGEPGGDQPARSQGRLDVTIAATSQEAGRTMTIPIVIRNSFQSAVRITSIAGPRTSDFRELTERDVREGERYTPRGLWRKLWKDMLFVQSMSFDVKFGTRVTADGKRNSAPLQGAADERVLPPHSETVAYMNIGVRRWLFFRPQRIDLNVEIGYEVDRERRSQIAQAPVDIKPPLRSMVIGAITGAVLGVIARRLALKGELQWSQAGAMALEVSGAAVMALIASVALARKSGTQGFITVEDFYGGFVLGVLIGYAGSEYFERAILPGKAGDTPPPPPGG